jgi:hypothetical protein
LPNLFSCVRTGELDVRSGNGNHTYRLNVAEDDLGCARQIEFEAASANRAMFMVQNLCGTREVEIFEDERRLGRIKLASAGGFWIVSS